MSKRILVVEDTINIRNILKINLKRLEFDVDLAKDGSTAIEHVRSGTIYDLFLLDIMLPDITGIEICRLIRKIDIFKKTPIIMLSAARAKENILLCKQAGANDFIMKPFTLETLYKKVTQYTNNN